MTGTFELRGFGLQGAYDPTQSDFLRAKLGVDVARAKFKVVDTQQTADTDAAETGIVGEMRAKTAATAPASTSRPSIPSPRLRRPSSALRPTGRVRTRSPIR